MPYSAIILMLGSALSVAFHGTIQRYLLREKLLGKQEALLLQSALAALIVLPFVAWKGFELNTHAILNWRLFWLALAGLILANLVIQFANVQARHAADASLSAPVQGMTPMLVTLGAVLLHEVPGVQGWTGIFLIAVGTWVHGAEGAKTPLDYLRPFAMLRMPRHMEHLTLGERQQVVRNVHALRWSYLSACVGTLGLICDGLVSRSGPIAIGYSVYFAVMAGCWLLWILFSKKEIDTRLMTRVKKAPFAMLGLGLFFATNAMAFALAFRLAPVAYVGSLKRLSIVFAVIIAWWFLGEKKAKMRIVPALVITAGAMVLAFDRTSGAVVSAAYEALK